MGASAGSGSEASYLRAGHIETFTFLDRNAIRDVALAWKEAIYKPGAVKILPCELRDLKQSWQYFRRTDCTSCRSWMQLALQS